MAHDYHNAMSPEKELVNPLEWLKNGTVCMYVCMYVVAFQMYVCMYVSLNFCELCRDGDEC